MQIGILIYLFPGIVLAQEYLPPKIVEGGTKTSVQEPTLPENYDFVRRARQWSELTLRAQRETQRGSRLGSYHVLWPDGRMQLVKYEAGPDGNKPQVIYMCTATFPAAGTGDKLDDYYYKAASNR